MGVRNEGPSEGGRMRYTQLQWGARTLHIYDGRQTLCGKTPPRGLGDGRRYTDSTICIKCRKAQATETPGARQSKAEHVI